MLKIKTNKSLLSLPPAWNIAWLLFAISLGKIKIINLLWYIKNSLCTDPPSLYSVKITLAYKRREKKNAILWSRLDLSSSCVADYFQWRDTPPAFLVQPSGPIPVIVQSSEGNTKQITLLPLSGNLVPGSSPRGGRVREVPGHEVLTSGVT